MEVKTISYSMLRKTEDFENDRAEVMVELAEGDSVGEAVKVAKRCCERALATSSEAYEGF
jgi:hypothetical protein